MTKLTRNPVHDSRVGFHVVGCSLDDVKKNAGGIHEMVVSKHDFALIFLLVCSENLGQAVGSLSGVRKVGAE